jgi:hypothetical protein
MKSLEDRLFDKYGSRLTLDELAHELKKEPKTIRKERCEGTFNIPMFREKAGKRSPLFADYRVVAKHLEDTSASGAPASPGRDGYNVSKSANPSSR